MSWDDIADKFKSLAAPTLRPANMDRVIDYLENFDDTPIKSLLPELAIDHG